MEPATRAKPRRGGFVAVALPCSLMLVAAAARPADAAGCVFEPQGEGRVAAVIDARTFRLQDGREVTLSGEDDTPDRYGRQPAFVFLDGSETSAQGLLLTQGEALVSAAVADKDCAFSLLAAEAAARAAKRGTWTDPAAIKNAESPGDILTGIGRFTVVEGKVLSVRQAGATTYLNFGRSWTQGFAVTISRRATAALEFAGIVVKSLENRRIRVRGWVEARGGPRIEVLRAGQIELLGEN